MRNRVLFFVIGMALAGCGSGGSSANLANVPPNPPAGIVLARIQTDESGLFRFAEVTGKVDLQGASGAVILLHQRDQGYQVEARLSNGLTLLADASFAEADRLALSGSPDQPMKAQSPPRLCGSARSPPWQRPTARLTPPAQ
jgi:hypothetical protein